MAGISDEHAQLIADAGLDRPVRRLTFTPRAVSDLEHLKRPTKALLERTLRDILLEPTGKLQVSVASPPPEDESDTTGWYEMPLGRFRVVFRTLPRKPDGPPSERIVAGVQLAERTNRHGNHEPLDLPAMLG
jgi:hypothetical protein